MTSTYAARIVVWLKNHPYHAPRLDVSSADSADIWYRFCAIHALCEYEDPHSHSMSGEPVPFGCDYVFLNQPSAGQRCSRPLAFGSSRCAFHSHDIFSSQFNAWFRAQRNFIIGGVAALQSEAARAPKRSHAIAIPEAQSGPPVDGTAEPAAKRPRLNPRPVIAPDFMELDPLVQEPPTTGPAAFAARPIPQPKATPATVPEPKDLGRGQGLVRGRGGRGRGQGPGRGQLFAAPPPRTFGALPQHPSFNA
jgi:hypothetical protein